MQPLAVMNQQTSNPSPDSSDSISNPKRLPVRILKVIVGLILVLALMFYVVRSGAMRAYEQPAQDTQQGDHQSDQGIKGTQDDRGTQSSTRQP